MYFNAVKPLRIALLSRRYPPQIGGAERVMANLADALARQSHQVTVLSSADRSDKIAPSTDLLPASAEENPKAIRLAYSGIKILGTFAYMHRISRWIQANRPDLVYVSMLKHDAYCAQRTCRKLNIPVVLRPEGAGITGDMHWQQTHWFGRIVRSQTVGASAFVALSDRIQTELMQCGYPTERIHFIPNGIPVPEIQWKVQQTQQKTVVFVGRLAFEKGLDYLIASWPEVLKAHPQARLKLIGSGPLEATLKNQAIQLQIPDSVEFAGSSEHIIAELMNASLFVLPSREEGLSIALLEAMSIGLPVVASNIPGNRTLITDGVTGRLAEVEQPCNLAGQIARALLHEPSTIQMAEAGRALVIDRFSIEAMAKSHSNLFESLIYQN